MKTLKISELIKELEEFKKEGDLEVFITNRGEACFDGVGKLFVIMDAKNDKQYLALLQNDDMLKI